MTAIDKIAVALCAWKESRSGGRNGMQSVINVIMNRVKAHGQSAYAVVYEPLQFSSMTYQHDPQLLRQPKEDDPLWLLAQELTDAASKDSLVDITEGSLYYYALYIAAPKWAKNYISTVVINNQQFLR